MFNKRKCVTCTVIFFAGLGLGLLLPEVQRILRLREFYAISVTINAKLLELHGRPPPGVSTLDWRNAVAQTSFMCGAAWNSPDRMSIEELLRLRTDLVPMIDHEPSSGDLLIRIWRRVAKTSSINYEFCTRSYPQLEYWLDCMKGEVPDDSLEGSGRDGLFGPPPQVRFGRPGTD